MRMKLQTKISLSISCVAIPCMLLVLGVSLSLQEQMLRTSVFSGLDALARTSAAHLAVFVSASMRDAKIAAEGLPVQRLATLDAGKADGELDAYLEKMSKNMPRFDNGMFLLDKEGRFITDYPPHPELRGHSFAYRDYFKRAASTLQPVMGEPYVSMRTKRPVQTFAIPILDSNRNLLAVLACSIDLLGAEGLSGIVLQKIGRTGYIYTFDRASRLMITHPDSDRVLKRDVAPGVNKLLDAAVDGYEGIGETVNSRGIPMFMSVHAVPGSSWLIAAQQPRDEVLAPMRAVRELGLAILIVIVLLAVTLSNLIAGYITRSLLRLHMAALSISKDLSVADIRHPISETSLNLLKSIENKDELGDLTSAFQELVEQLDSKICSLHQAVELTKHALHFEQLAHTQQTRLIAMISHEFRNPLAIIKSQMQLAQREALVLPESHRRIKDTVVHRLGAIERATNRLEVLFEQWLDNDRLNAGDLCVAGKEIFLDEWLAKVVSSSASSITGGREISVQNTVESIWADDALLRAAILNLLDNANKYSPAGTPIEVSVKLSDTSGSGQEGAAREVEISIANQGEGIHPSIRDKIFERYFRGHHGLQIEGRGLGLYFVRRVAELHGGHVAVNCPKGGGTIFTISIPKERKASATVVSTESVSALMPQSVPMT